MFASTSIVMNWNRDPGEESWHQLCMPNSPIMKKKIDWGMIISRNKYTAYDTRQLLKEGMSKRLRGDSAPLF